jgi:transcription termination factor Rho
MADHLRRSQATFFTRFRMSNNTNEDTLPQPLAGSAGDAPSARKRVTKKAASKTATQPDAEKVPAKKAAAKKAAVKKVVAKKTAAKKSLDATLSPELPFITPPAPTAAPAPVSEAAAAPRPARASRAKKVAAEAPATPPPTLPPAPAQQAPIEAPRRYGRVPGGGPIATREPAEDAPQAVQPPPREREPQEPRRGQERQQEPQRNPQQRDGQGQPNAQGQQNTQGQPRESRSKRRRDKRKRRSGERQEQGGQTHQPHQGQQHPPNRQRHESGGQQANSNDFGDRRAVQLNGPKIETNGMLELAPKGFGFLRIPDKNFEQARDDVFVTPETIRKYNLRLGQWIHGVYQEGPRGPQLVEITRINDMPPEEAAKLPHFDELKAINPTRRISFETTPERFTTRVIDIMAPVGRGQRGLIVSPPRSGKTTLLLHMAEAIREKYDEAIHLMVVLVDERPEEVTEFRRALPGVEIYASSNDEQPRNHCRMAELAIERAKRLVEAGKDVFLLMDSITRLARAYNAGMSMGAGNRNRGTGSGGITIGALEVPRRLFAAARNTRGGGSLTILATALIQTNSRADEAIYMEFKGTGNMELVLDRKIAENYIYPAVDIFKSGTRREELLLADHMLHKIHLIRRGLSGHRPAEAMERLLFFLKKFSNNPQMLMEIKG